QDAGLLALAGAAAARAIPSLQARSTASRITVDPSPQRSMGSCANGAGFSNGKSGRWPGLFIAATVGSVLKIPQLRKGAMPTYRIVAKYQPKVDHELFGCFLNLVTSSSLKWTHDCNPETILETRSPMTLSSTIPGR